MSIPRVLLAPSHRTRLADAVAASVAELSAGRGQQVRYHHLGPLGPACVWDRWEGTAFLDPAVCSREDLLGLFDVATRGATLSLLSSSTGLLDRPEGAPWTPADVARLLDCPIVALLDCRGWGTGIRALVSGLRSQLAGLNLAGSIVSGVADRDHLLTLKQVLSEEKLPVLGCLFHGDGPGWDAVAPGAWGLPLKSSILDAVSRQVDVGALVSVAGQRGFLSSQSRLTDRGGEGPTVAVAGGKGFTAWSRDSIEVLRAAGAQIKRLDLLEDQHLPAGLSGLVLAGTLWPAVLPEVAMNTSLMSAMHSAITGGLPTIALGGGMLLLLDRVHDSLGRSSDLAGVIPSEAEILWDLEDAAYVEVNAAADSLLLQRGDALTGWTLTEVEMSGPATGTDGPLTMRGPGGDLREGFASASLFGSSVLLHFASLPGMAPRFVGRCAAYATDR